MRQISIINRQPLSLGDDCLVFKVGEEESICTDCKRFREEFKKLKNKKKEDKML